MTQQQVSRSSKTLVQAIRDRDVESPALMSWNPWQQWRRDAGLRPTAAADGEATTSAQESALWKSTMLELYGTEWPLKLLEQGEALVVATTQPDGPGGQPAAGALVIGTTQPGEPGLEPAAGADTGWRATSLVDPVVEALQAEVAQLKEELATLLILKSTVPQSCEPGPEPAALANPHKGDPRWSLHNAWLQKRTQKQIPKEVQVPEEKQCTAARCAGIVNKVVTVSQICEECTGEPACSIAKRVPQEVQVPNETKQKQCTAARCAGVVKEVMTVSQTCEECTGEPACSIAKKGPKKQSHKEGDDTAPREPFQSEWKVRLSRKQRRRINKETKQSGKEPREFPPHVKGEPAT